MTKLFAELNKATIIGAFLVRELWRYLTAKDAKSARDLFTSLYVRACHAATPMPRVDIGHFFPESRHVDIMLCGNPVLLTTETYPNRWSLMSLADMLMLSTMVRLAGPATIFEFGTHRGNSARLFYANTPSTTKIYTLDIEPLPPGDQGIAHVWADPRVSRLVANSHDFDYRPFAAQIDFIVIDGGHDYATVANDTRAALTMIRSGGLIVWHDYHPNFPDVVKCLNELAGRRALFHLKNTQFVAHRHE